MAGKSRYLPASKLRQFYGFAAALLIYAGLICFIGLRSGSGSADYAPYWAYRFVLWRGWLTTVAISLAALFLSLFAGLFLYFMEKSRWQLLRAIAKIHKAIIFGTPLVVIAIVSYYYVGFAFGLDSKFWIGAITLALYTGAYISDIYKGAVEAIHPNQWQTAEMFGFRKWQTYRYIIFPQVFRQLLPPLTGQFALTIKGSSLLSYMATDEFLNAIKTIQAASFRYSEGFVVVTLGYLLLTIPLIQLIRHLEVKLEVEGSRYESLL